MSKSKRKKNRFLSSATSSLTDKSAATKKRYSGIRAMVILGILVLVTIALGSVASWRSLPTTSSPMPQGTPPQMPASAPARDYVYAGSSLISTVDPFRDPPNDIAVWRPSTGVWYILNSQQQAITVQWGVQNDVPAPGDFDGDGKTDFCVFRPSTGAWYIILSSSGANQYDTYGTTDDIPVIGDYDGDGRSDVAIWRPTNQTWYVHQSSNAGYFSSQFGSSGDKPIAADFDGDGKTDLATWRNSTHAFWVLQSGNTQSTSYSLGQTDDEPVVGDYDGDGRSDYATRRPSDGIWRIRYSADATGTIHSETWGVSSDIAVQARYNDAADTDSKTDIAVWRPSTGAWYIRRSTDGSMRAVLFGAAGDIPVPSNWRR